MIELEYCRNQVATGGQTWVGLVTLRCEITPTRDASRDIRLGI